MFFFTLTHIIIFFLFFIEPFWLLVSKSYSSLYLVNSTGHCSPTCAASFKRLSVFLDGSPFLSIYGQLYPTFWPLPGILPFDVPLALVFVGDMSHFCLLYSNCMGWSKRNSWSCILLGAWLGTDIFEEPCYWWILSRYHMDCTSFEYFLARPLM